MVGTQQGQKQAISAPEASGHLSSGLLADSQMTNCNKPSVAVLGSLGEWSLGAGGSGDSAQKASQKYLQAVREWEQSWWETWCKGPEAAETYGFPTGREV